VTQYSYTQSFGQTTVSGNTPYGTWDSNSVFCTDCQKTSVWTARKLGFPILSVEVNDYHLYGAFEESVLKYSSVITSHQATNWFLDYLGRIVSSSSDNFTTQIPRSDIGFLKSLVQPYAVEADVNSKAALHTGSFTLGANAQSYDLKTLSTGTLIIRDVWHAPTPAMNKISYFDYPSDWQWEWIQNDYPGMSYPGGGIRYQIYPVFSNVVREQETKMSQTVRKSQFTYILHNNVIRITPKPDDDLQIWFSYYLEDPKKEFGIEWSAQPTASASEHFVTNIANIPFQELNYTTLNTAAKTWIRSYTLAVAKEILGNIRSKVQSIPIPGGEVTLNGSDLRQEGKEEKDALMEELKASLEELSFDRLMEKRANINDNIARTFKNIPFPKPLFIG
jgi:hypothetical protein